ncbi:MAG: L-2-hydroxyglutarate oxidase [Pirellulaceae bacterium]|nr:L-2-hydroxyglutarate oxidase [Planctomycetales bacterium]
MTNPSIAVYSGGGSSQVADVAILGAGIVGLATAYRWGQRFPDAKIVVIDKESSVASHQTGHNSGVLHSGIYYKPGSLKAVNCRRGKAAMEQFCTEQKIPFEICGKVIVAVDDDELPILQRIYDRGQQNGVRCELIDRDRLRELEPHAAGIHAIHVPEAGIIDYLAVSKRLAELIQQRGGQLRYQHRVTGIRTYSDHLVVATNRGDTLARVVINCTGLHCDRVARSAGIRPDAKIVPFRGEYYELLPAARHLCRNLIYPVPDPKFPFLGVHFTRMINGHVECGPNAVLALAREGYRWRDVNLSDLIESLTYPGFLRMAIRHWRMGLGEMWRSFSKPAFVRALQRLVPDIRAEHLVAAPAGVRAQAVATDGGLVDDFLIQQHDRIIHVGNAPSPAATSSLNIGQTIVDQAVERLSGSL